MRLETPTLRSALLPYHARGVDALTSALLNTTSGVAHPDLTARLAANQVLTALQVLANANQRRIDKGCDADALAPVALAEADHAFDLLRNGLAPYAWLRPLARTDALALARILLRSCAQSEKSEKVAQDGPVMGR